MRAGAGLFEANGNEVSAEQFRQFASRLDLRGRYPGMQGLGFAVHVPAERLDAFLRDVRAHVHPTFRVWPEDPREDYYPILYLQPEDRRNLAAIGYDMFAEPVRRAAMLAAATTRTAAASGRVTLVQEIDPQKQAGFLIYVPVFENAAGAGGLPGVAGFVYSPFRAGDFLSAVFNDIGSPEVSLSVYDGKAAEAGRLLLRVAPDRCMGRCDTTPGGDPVNRRRRRALADRCQQPPAVRTRHGDGAAAVAPGPRRVGDDRPHVGDLRRGSRAGRGGIGRGAAAPIGRGPARQRSAAARPRGCGAARPRRGGGRQPCQGRVPGDALARAADAAQRHPRLGDDAPQRPRSTNSSGLAPST